MPKYLRIPAMLAFLVFCSNVVVIAWGGGYAIQFGPVHITAHGLFKPMLALNGSFILALMACGARRGSTPSSPELFLQEGASMRSRLCGWMAIGAFALCLYAASAHINLGHEDWTHRHISEGIRSLHSVWSLFTNRQADGFYRPVTFLSLWMDYRLFGAWYPGYHIQSIALHVLNSFLVISAAKALGFGRMDSLWAGILFSAAAVNFEPVLWPAARFDLLATALTLAAFVLAIRYFRAPSLCSWDMALSGFCFMLGLLNKESSYCLPILVFFVVCTHPVWTIPRPRPAKFLTCFSIYAAVTLLMLSIRIAVYGNLGGYTAVAGGQSPHFHLGAKAWISLLKVLPLSFFGVNTTYSAPAWLPVLITFFSFFLFAAALASRGCFQRKEYMLAACALLASLPVINIVGWIGSPMQHSRYLYLPGVFTILMMVSLLRKGRRSGLFLTGYFLVNATGVMFSISSYDTMLARADSMAESVRTEWAHECRPGAICLVDLPEHIDGVFYFGSELAGRIHTRIPQATITRLNSGGEEMVPESALAYRWSNSAHSLVRIRLRATARPAQAGSCLTGKLRNSTVRQVVPPHSGLGIQYDGAEFLPGESRISPAPGLKPGSPYGKSHTAGPDSESGRS